MSGTTSQLQAHYDRPIHTKRIRDDGTIEGVFVETHYVIAEHIAIREGDDWLTIIMDFQDVELETRIPLDFLRTFLSEYDSKKKANTPPIPAPGEGG